MFNYKLLRGYHTAFMLPVLFTGLLLTAPAQAVTFSVNSQIDAPDTNLADGLCEGQGAGGACTLRAAIQQANDLMNRTDATRDTNIVIGLLATTYTLSIPGTNEDNAAQGDLDIRGTCPSVSINTPCLTINGNATIIDGGGLDRVFHIVGRNTVNINNVTIRNGVVRADGGAINNANGWLTLGNCTITNNTIGHATISGSYSGGGLYNGSNAQMVVNNCIISNNSILNVTANAVGAFIGGGGIFNSGIMTLNKTTVKNNSGRPFGGGIQNSNGAATGTGKLTINESIVLSNTNAGNNAGGGISNHGGAVTLTRTIVRLNTALEGGGVSNLDGAGQSSVTGSLRVISSVVDSNTGGGILNQGGAEIIYSTISGNKANGNGASADGGGIYNRAPGDVTVTNSTITGNNAFRAGGGIFNGRTLTLTNVTLSGNTAEGSGEEMFVSVDPNPANAAKLNNAIHNTIIGGNTAPVSGQLNCMSGYNEVGTAITAAAKMMSGGNNLENGNSCGLTATDIINASPNLGTLGENGNNSPDTLLLVTSDNATAHPAVFVPQAPSAAIGAGTCINKFDQRLYGRPGNNTVCDIGAVETDGVEAVGRVDLEVAVTGNTPNVSLDNPVTYTLVVTNKGPGAAQGVTLTAQIPLGTSALVVPDATNLVSVVCVTTANPVNCSTPNLAVGASFTVFITVTPTDPLLNNRTIEMRARADVTSPSDYLPGNNGSLDSCVSGACVVTAVAPGTNFGTSDGGGGAFGFLDLLLLGAPGALLLRRRKIRA